MRVIVLSGRYSRPVCLPDAGRPTTSMPAEIIQKFAAKEAGIPAGAQQLHLPPEREDGGTGSSGTGGQVGRGGGHHLHARRQAHREGGVRAGDQPAADQPVARRRAGSAQRAAVRADHAGDSGLRHPVPGQGEGRRDRLLHVLGEAQEDGARASATSKARSGWTTGPADREDLRQGRRHRQKGDQAVPQVRNLSRADRQQVLVPHLHPRRPTRCTSRAARTCRSA